MKRLLGIVLCLVFTMGVAMQAAQARGTTVAPYLEFQDRTAYCSARVTSNGDKIEAEMELWQGSTFIDSWSKSGTGSVLLSGEATVKKGLKYTLKVNGTIAGVPFNEVTTSGTC